jgi:hypothetical protein
MVLAQDGSGDTVGIQLLRQLQPTERAPDQIVATKYPNDDPTKPALFTRPLCPYRAVATWNGTGDTSDAANWSCRTH